MNRNSLSPVASFISEDRAEALIRKWAPVLDFASDRVKAIEDDHSRLSTAILLENQERWCFNEATAGAGGIFGSTGLTQANTTQSGDSYATGDARLPKVLIPMVRRTFPELITNEIVGVQPMAGPVGMAFALRYRYETDSLGGSGPDGYGTVGPLTATNSGVPRQFDGTEIGYNTLDTRFTGTSSAMFTQAVTAAQAVTGVNALSSAESALLGNFFKEEDFGVAALLNDLELTGNVPQATVTIEKTVVQAGSRKLAARWSLEAEQDLKNMHGLDISDEMLTALSYEIQAEIDREMINRMLQVCIKAGKNKGFSFWYPASADARWLGERNRDLYAKIVVEANRIAIRNRRGAANFIIATPRVCAILEMLKEFAFMPVNGTVNTSATGIAKVGVLGGRFTIYRDTRTEAQWIRGGANARTNPIEFALLGYKGSEYFDTGIIYCPYIPVMVQKTIGPNDFSPRIGLSTRYGVVDHIFGADLYYHLIICVGLGDGFLAETGKIYL